MSQRQLALILFGCLVALFLQFRASHDTDLFWQVRLGQLACQQGELIRNDMFTATHAGEPVPPIAWLSQILYALVYRAGSWRLLHQANALVFAGGLVLASLTARGRQGSTLAGILGLSLGVLAAAPHCEIRPHTLAIFWFALLLLLVETEMRVWWKLALAGVILVLWQNMHPSVLLGAVAVGTRAGAGWCRWPWNRPAAKPWLLTVLALLAGLSSVATPVGPGIFESSRINAEVSRELAVSEWMPLWHPAAWQAGAWIAWLVLGVSLVLLLLARRRVRLEDLAIFLVLGVLSLLVYRLALFLAVAMVPVWSRWIEAAWFADRRGRPEVKPVQHWLAAITVAGGLLCVLIVPRLLELRLFDEQLPFAAIQRMRQMGVRGVIYNYREWGGPLIWEGYPDWKLTIDGRLYLFNREEWHRYQQIALGRVPVAQVQRQYRPAAFFLRPTYHQRFIRLLRESDQWKEAYADRNAIVFVRRRRAGGV
jgi:hypothetical protein